ncbi:hypothetical protein TU87_03475 [Pseudomonas weihenstephanensis]|nr:hypothetical protein TU87_03475 [Pseudomonas weihenstephanensis]
MDGQFARIVMAASEAFYLTRTGFAYMKKAMTDRNHLIERMMCIPKIGLEPVEWPPSRDLRQAIGVAGSDWTFICCVHAESSSYDSVAQMVV